MSTKKKYSVLDHKKHGVGGLVPGKIKYRKQDRLATPAIRYAVVFFPRINVKFLGRATIDWPSAAETISQTPQAAKIKFMDRLGRRKKGKQESWASYSKAGHKIRKIKITDIGDA